MIKKILLLLLITFLHYGIHTYYSVLHVLHREFYFIPIVFAAFWFGEKECLAVAVISSFLFLPKILFMEDPLSSIFGLSNLLDIPMFLTVAYLIGHLRDIRQAGWRTITKDHRPATVQGHPKLEHRVLMCIYNSLNSGPDVLIGDIRS